MSGAREPTLCLCMIVRDEAAVIGRALASVRPYLDAWVVCDTGSTDRTPDLVMAALDGIPGELHHHAWVDFGHNRSAAIALARLRADYVLILDADMTLAVRDPDFKRSLIADRYWLRYDDPLLDYAQVMLVASRHAWRFIGVTHEYITADTATTDGVLPSVSLVHHGDGGNRANKFTRDAALLTEALARDPADYRAMFYLAESYAHLGRFAEALYWYRERTRHAGWEEERWYALFRAAVMQDWLGTDWASVQQALLVAYAARPTRLEPIFHIVQHYRERGEFAQGYLFAALAGHGIRYPDDYLFIARAIYAYHFAFEYGLCACAVGRVSEAIEAFNAVLNQPVDPPLEIITTARHARRLAVEAMFPMPAEARAARRRVVVLAPFRDAGAFLARNVASVLEQRGAEVLACYINDASTDGSECCIPTDDARIMRLDNAESRGALWNLHRAVGEVCEEEDIVVMLDGDDWLAAPDALAHVADLHARSDCWVTYGQFTTPDGALGFAQPFASEADFRTLRRGSRVSHLRSFRAALFRRIADQDPDLACFRDDRGRWLRAAADAAVMFPLLEMAGFARVRFNDRVLCVYNDANPRCHHAQPAARRDQEAMFAAVQRKRPFARIDSLMPAGRVP